MGHFVYKYVVDDEIVYIGKNDTDLHSRIKAHEKDNNFKPILSKCKIYYTQLANACMSDVIESALINEYNPPLNTAKKNLWDGLDLPGIRWKEYEKPKQDINKLIRKKKKLLKEIEDIQLSVQNLKFNNDFMEKYVFPNLEKYIHEKEMISILVEDCDFEYITKNHPHLFITTYCSDCGSSKKGACNHLSGCQWNIRDKNIINIGFTDCYERCVFWENYTFKEFVDQLWLTLESLLIDEKLYQKELENEFDSIMEDIREITKSWNF